MEASEIDSCFVHPCSGLAIRASELHEFLHGWQDEISERLQLRMEKLLPQSHGTK